MSSKIEDDGTVAGYMTMAVKDVTVGTMRFLLCKSVVPKTVQNFVSLLEEGYLGTTFHRLVPRFVLQGGGESESSTEQQFDDENFVLRHDRRGTLSMANAGPHTNDRQFFITLKPAPHLDHKHVVFGYLDHHHAETMSVLSALEGVGTLKGTTDTPAVSIRIVDCGLLKEEEAPETDKSTPIKEDLQEGGVDEDEIDLDEEEEEKPMTKSQKLKDRLRKLKMKMNQSRQLNRKEVLSEGERMGNGYARESKRMAKQDKQLRAKEWVKSNKIADDASSLLIQQAEDSLKKSAKKAESMEASRFQMTDYHNPEAQYQRYAKNLKSVVGGTGGEPRQQQQRHEMYDPTDRMNHDGMDDEQVGAQRLSKEMKRRAAKTEEKKRQRDVEFEASDVSYINKRNKRFNEKIGRNYDKHTAEIRQNLERGTAL